MTPAEPASHRFVILGPAGDESLGSGEGRSFHGGHRYRELAEQILGPHGAVAHVEWAPAAPLDERATSLDSALVGADALVIMPWYLLFWSELPRFDGDRLGALPNLRVIAGTHDFRLGWIDLGEATRRAVVLVDTSRSMTPTVAEFGVAITFALLRDIPSAIDLVRRGEWIRGGMAGTGYVFRDLADCRVGLAGYGSINRHYRDFVRPYGCEMRAYDPFVDHDALGADGVIGEASLVELAAGSDILVVAIPPTPATLGVVDARVIDAMPPGALFVLLSRMAVVDQEALWRRVRAKEIRAAVDVFDPEPPPIDAWFRTAPNVLPTPHIAGNVEFAHERCFREACEDTVRALNGEKPRYVVAERDRDLYEGALTVAGEGPT